MGRHGVAISGKWRAREDAAAALEGEEINVDAKDSSSQTPLSWAAQRGYRAVVQLLLEKGADIMAKECNGWTTLHRAAANGHKEIVQLLLEKGADIEAKNSNGWTAVAGGGCERTRGGGAAAAEERGQRRGGGWHWTGNYNLTEEFHTQAAVVLSSSKLSEDSSGFLVDRDLWGSARALVTGGILGILHWRIAFDFLFVSLPCGATTSRSN
jgi:Ankyrin repeats (3 copies)